MPTYIALLTFTDKGSKEIKRTTSRADAFRKIAAARGIKIRRTYWLNGPFDGLHIFEVDREEDAIAHSMALASFGNVKTQTFRALTRKEVMPILESIPDPHELAKGQQIG